MPLVNYSIWPKPKLSFKDLVSKKSINISIIEEYFMSLYPNTNAVLMPSARSGISAILDLLGFSRKDYVWVPPYASHCVLNAVSFRATPNPTWGDLNKASIIFHQWGFINTNIQTGVLIEDSVDSLIPPGGSVFPNNGRFELLSLPKIFSTVIGGVILCQEVSDAVKLREIRNRRRNLGNIHASVKLLSLRSITASIFWENSEHLNGFSPYWALNDIFRKIKTIDQIVIDRERKIKDLLNDKVSIVKLLPLGRLISCWPIPNNDKIDQVYIRHISDDAENPSQIKVLPIPLHMDFTLTEVQRLVNKYG